MIEQGTEEWFKERMGRCTASKFHHVRSSFGFSEGAKGYMLELIAERLTNVPTEGFDNADTRRGIEQEPYAKMNYTAKTLNIVEDIGFVKHKDTSILAGYSPDGFVGKEGTVEIKCVKKKVQLKTIFDGRNKKNYCPEEHIVQIQGGMWITDRKWCDFVSYSPDLPDNLCLFISRVHRNDGLILAIERDIKYFLDEVNKEFKKFKKYKMESIQ